MPQARWKRLALGILSSFMLLGGGYAAYQIFLSGGDYNIYLNCLVGFWGFIAILAFVTSLFGCDRCVAKVLGRAGPM